MSSRYVLGLVKTYSRMLRNLFSVFVATALAAMLCGCGLFHKKKATLPAARGNASAPGSGAQASLIVAPTAVGKVASVNSQARFAVVVFPVGQLPAANTRMVVYRADAKVGEVKITGQTLDNLAVGDIVLGSVQENDEVRGD